MTLKSQKRLLKYLHFHFSPWTWCRLPNTILAVLVYACHGEETCRCMLWCTIVGIAPSANFDRATNEKLHVWWLMLGHAGQWVATVSYSIGIMDAVCWGGGSRSERSKFVTELLCFILPACLKGKIWQTNINLVWRYGTCTCKPPT